MVLSVFLLLAQLDPTSLVPLYRQALVEQEKRFGPDHARVARSAADLGLYLRSLGERGEAAALLARALAIDEKTIADNAQVAEDRENLASVSAPETALALHIKAASSSDPAISARNWGRAGDLYNAQGNRTDALNAYRTALRKEEAASGPHSPRVAVRINDLAQVVEPKIAEPLIRRALAIEVKAFGSHHPATGVTLNNLASALLAMKRFAEAEGYARRALRALEKTLGANHPRVAIVTSNLAGILREKLDLAGSRRLYERVLAIDEMHYGPERPEVAVDLRNLAEVLESMGEKAKAHELLRRASRITAAP